MESNDKNDNFPFEEDDYQTQRTIEEVIDVETGEMVLAEDFFAQDEAIIVQARTILQISNQSDLPKYKCPYCEQNVRISGRRNYKRNKLAYFFAHHKDSDDCPIKTGLGLSLEKILAKKYHGLKESELHRRLKNNIANYLQGKNAFEKGIKDVLVEKTFKNEAMSDNWRRPDVSANYNDKKIVFELQLSTTFLSVIVGRDSFYRKHETYIIWIFGGFSKEVDFQRLMEKDIYYSHKRNVFLLDDAAKEASEEKQELILHCYWQVPKILNEKVKIEWHKKLISLDELSFDKEKFESYYYNSDKDFYDIADPKEKAIIEAWDKFKEDRWDKIKKRIAKRELSQEQQNNLEQRNQLKEKELLEKYQNNEITPTRFSQDGKWGYRIKNHVVIEPQYESASSFKFGFATVKSIRKYSNDTEIIIIDSSGNAIINLGTVKFIELSLLNEQLLRVKFEETDYRMGYSRSYSRIMRKIKEEKEQIINFKGQIVYDEVQQYSESMHKAKRNGKWGCIDEEGNELTEFMYDTIKELSEGRAGACKDYKYWGCLDEKGKEVIPFEFDEIGSFSDGLAKVKKKGIWGSVNLFGEVQIDEIVRIANDVNKVKKMGLWGLTTIAGLELTPCVYEGIGYFNKSEGIGHLYDNVDMMNLFRNKDKEYFLGNKTKVKKNGKIGIIDKEGNEIIPCEYGFIGNFDNGIAIASKDYKSGFINENGVEIIPFVYDQVEKFNEGIAKVKKGNSWGLIDTMGVAQVEAIVPFDDGLNKIKKIGFWGLALPDNKEVIPCEFDEIKSSNNGIIRVNRKGKWGGFDISGNVAIPTIFLTEELLDRVESVEDVDAIQIYKDMNGDLIVPSLNYLEDSSVISFFQKNPVKAKVEGNAEFGVFLSLNSMIKSGLLHKTEIWKMKLNINDSQFDVGNTIYVCIKSIELHSGKMSFSLPDTKALVYEHLKKLEGNVVQGKIQNIKEYGLFVEVCEYGIGLVHISNLKNNGYRNVNSSFHIGDLINVQIISVKPEERKIQLGIVSHNPI